MAVDWSQAQAAVIGSALIDARCVPEILAEMRPEDFSGPCLTLFEAIRALSAERTPIDAVVVLAKVGPAYKETVRDLIEQTPTTANLRAYIRLCREQSRLQLLRRAGAELAGAVTLEEARDCLARAAGVSLDTGKQTSYSGMELAAEWINEINAGAKPEYVTTGIGALDSTVRTVRGNFHIIAGYTSHGKSAFALQLAWSIAQTRSVGFFSYETLRPEFLHRLISMISGTDYDRVKSEDLSAEELNACTRAAGELFNSKLNYEDAAGMTVDDIRAKTLQHGYEVIFVDYLQKVQPPAKRRRDRFEDVTEISSGLQTLAHNLNVVVFALSQLSRARDEGDWIPPPPLASLRESGQIEQDADAVIFVHAPLRRSMPRFRVLDVAKNRTGRIERFFIAFRGELQRFDAPTTADYRIWSETMRKRRPLTAEERRALEDAAEEKQKRALDREMEKRRAKKRDRGEQAELPL